MHRKHYQFLDFIPMRVMRCPTLLVLAILLTSTSLIAHAETSASVSVVSDYRFRGELMSNGNPEAQLNVTYDAQNGWYAGGFASGVKLEDEDDQQVLLYSGFARTFSSGWSWDLGLMDSRFLTHGDYSYTEAFAGISSENINAKLYFAPNYFGASVRTAYAELNASYPVGELFRVLAHIGCLYRLSGETDEQTARARIDSEIGISKAIADWNFQLAWVSPEKKKSEYIYYSNRHPHNWILSTTYSF